MYINCPRQIAAAMAAVVTSMAWGAIETQDISATLQLPVAGAGQAISAGDFTVLAWVRPSSLPEVKSEAGANIVHIDNAFFLKLQNNGALHAGVNGNAGELSATTGIVFDAGQGDQWALIGVSFDASQGLLSVWTRSESSSLLFADAAQSGFVVGPVGPSLHVGAVGQLPAMLGTYGLIAVRKHTITASDFDDIWNYRRHHGPFSLDNSKESGSMTGPQGCVWMINHAMTTRPIDGGVGGQQHQRAAVVDKPVTQFNTHVYDVTGVDGQSLRVARPVIDTHGFTHRSPYEQPGGGVNGAFFERTLPEVSDTFPPPPHHVARVSPLARLLATDLPPGIGHVRVMASANSRGIQAGDGSATGTGNFIHGFIWNNLDRTAGVLNRPARLNPGPWFGFDASQHNPHYQGDVTKLRFTDFSRFWTSSHTTLSPGPGEGVHLANGASYTMRCRPQGLIQADQPLMIQAHLLRFPGASDVRWIPNKHTQQGEAGTNVGGGKVAALDTQTWSHVLDTNAGDQVISTTRITLMGDQGAVINVGDACYVGGGSISVVSAVTFNGESTVIDFQHPFIAPPANGSLLRFGPWELTTVWHAWPGLDAADPAEWRGLRIEAEGGGGEGVVLFSFDAWRPNVDGFLFAAAGWGGMGYEQQVGRSFTGVTGAWAAQLNIDVWLQMFATQLSHPNSMDLYTAQIRTGLPHVEMLWLGDIEHPSNWDGDIWHWWALNFANVNQVVASSLLLHPDLGGQLDLFGDGIRSDVLHTSQRGNQRLAELWTDVLLVAALPGPLPKKGDINADGVVDASDLLALLSAWGMCDNLNTCNADLNGDGIVDVSDLLLLLSSWG